MTSTLEMLMITCSSLCIRSMLSIHPHSGQNQPPLYGDYEAQRHWQEVTVHLPVQDWYFNTTDNDLEYWGLDYPPLTAYHSYLNGRFAETVLRRKDFVALHESRGIQTEEHRVFMRSSVLFSDVFVFLPACLFFSKVIQDSGHRSLIALALFPGLILIDHGHFQYNNVSLGLMIAAVSFLWISKDCWGSMCFVLALSYKQMELFHALPFFFYLLGKSAKTPNYWTSFWKLFRIAGTVVITATVVWFPFIDYGTENFRVLRQVIHRIFPIARGIFEDKVANFWCSLNVLYKLKMTMGKEELALLCLIVTAVVCVPSNLHLLFRPTKINFLLSLVNTSLSFFIFSFQVHEKSILLPAIPVAMWVGLRDSLQSKNSRLMCIWFLTTATVSMFPLLRRDGLTIPTFSLTVLFLVLSDMTKSLEPVNQFTGSSNKRVRPIESRSKSDLFLRISFYSSILFSAALMTASVMISPPSRYPDLWPVLTSLYSAIHFGFFLFYFHYLQFTVQDSVKKNI